MNVHKMKAKKRIKNHTQLKFKIWDEFGKPIDKFKDYPKNITSRIKKVLKKYE